jgi:hypothetical protein
VVKLEDINTPKERIEKEKDMMVNLEVISTLIKRME